MDEIERAVYDTVHDFRDGSRRGAAALAPHVNMNAGTLSNKADPAMTGHQMNLREALAVMLATRDARILKALAADLGYACIPFAMPEVVDDTELLERLTKWQAEIGETAQAIHRAISGRRITRENYAEVRREIHEDIETEFMLLGRLDQLVEP